MARYVIDLVFDEKSGAVKLTVDFHDPSQTQLEVIEAIRNGEVREDVLEQISAVLGQELADRVENGDIDMVCLDDHPELRDRRPETSSQTVADPEPDKQEIAH